VVKDWSLTIRASQVIPVYPLTEDLQPGDIFLVSTRIEDQVAAYESDGFLPLENLLTRLTPRGYDAFYKGRFGVGGNPPPPRKWEEAPATSSPPKNHNWEAAPRAAFPSYSFTIKRGQGLNLAIPVQGVPVGLSFMNVAKATGTIQIADAYTYGIDLQSLHEQVEEWGADNRVYLGQFVAQGDGSEDIHYLRIIARVYLTGKVNISLLNEEARGAAANVGAVKSDTLKELAVENSDKDFVAINKALAEGSDSATGGSLKLTAFSGRSVSMVETFPRPLVIGYLGFDLPILKGGMLGAPVPTQVTLAGGEVLAATPWGTDFNSERIKKWLKAKAENKAELRKWLDDRGYKEYGLTNVLAGLEFAGLRSEVVKHFKIP
jgi:hypothetical protein